MKKEDNLEIFICACHSFEHQALFWYDEDDDINKETFIYIHLSNYKNFFRRLWFGIKYAFGYKSKFGEWDQFILDEKNEKKLRDYLNKKYRKI